MGQFRLLSKLPHIKVSNLPHVLHLTKINHTPKAGQKTSKRHSNNMKKQRMQAIGLTNILIHTKNNAKTLTQKYTKITKKLQGTFKIVLPRQ